MEGSPGGSPVWWGAYFNDMIPFDLNGFCCVISSGEVFMKKVAWCSWWVQWWYRRADEGKFPVFMMWSRARSGHRNLYTHLQDTYITSSVVSEGRWKVTVSVLQGEALSWVARIKGAFVTQFIMCYTWKTLAPNPDGGGGATGLLQSWRWCHLHWDLKDEQKLALKALDPHQCILATLSKYISQVNFCLPDEWDFVFTELFDSFAGGQTIDFLFPLSNLIAPLSCAMEFWIHRSSDSAKDFHFPLRRVRKSGWGDPSANWRLY